MSMGSMEHRVLGLFSNNIVNDTFMRSAHNQKKLSGINPKQSKPPIQEPGLA